LTLEPSEQRATNRFFDRQFGRPCIKVLPGEYAIVRDDTMLVTVLGSCVAACIRDTASGIGGMNHFMLPDGADGDDEVSYSMRYGACAMEVLINELVKAGAQRKRLVAKVFGGGRVIEAAPGIDVGDRNAAFVRRYLATEGVPVLAADLGRNWGRKVVFFADSGEARVKKVIMTPDRGAWADEERYAKRLQQQPRTSGDIDLF
jgi:chemotaxis protein CheD